MTVLYFVFLPPDSVKLPLLLSFIFNLPPNLPGGVKGKVTLTSKRHVPPGKCRRQFHPVGKNSESSNIGRGGNCRRSQGLWRANSQIARMMRAPFSTQLFLIRACVISERRLRHGSRGSSKVKQADHIQKVAVFVL